MVFKHLQINNKKYVPLKNLVEETKTMYSDWRHVSKNCRMMGKES
jgi:hypothetical protein